MRRKLILSLLSVAVLAVVAGDYLFNRSSGAQEASKKSEAETRKPNELFDLLKMELEGKQMPTPVVPPLPPVKTEATPVPTSPLAPGGSLPPLPSNLSPLSNEGTKSFFSTTPPPGPVTPVSGSEPPAGGIPAPVPLPAAPKEEAPGTPVAADKGSAPTAPAPMAPVPPAPPPVSSQPETKTSEPSHLENRFPRSDLKPMPSIGVAPPVTESGVAQPNIAQPVFKDPLPAPGNPTKDSAVKPAIGEDSPPLAVVPPPSVAPGARIQETKPARVNQPAPGPVKLKNSPWSLHIDLVNEQTIVTASVNKKHEFKIVCQHVDLQTAHNVFKAIGKVQISGEGLQANCETLAIVLYEDRLVLEGGAEVRIRKTAASVHGDSEAKPAVFELKGETLNLRISELSSAKFVEASQQRITEDAGGGARTVLASMTSAAREWSPYGTLRRTSKDHDGQAIWCLEGHDGQPLFHFVTRGVLGAYEGRTISVYGATTVPVDGRPLLRVSHIALP